MPGCPRIDSEATQVYPLPASGFHPTAKTAPQPQPSDTLHGTVRILMRDGKWLVKPGERPELRDDVRGQEPAVWPE